MQAEPASKYISHGEMIGQARARTWSRIPMPPIDIPHFRFGDKQQGGVGQGDGDVGDALGRGQPGRRQRQGRRGRRASTSSRSTSDPRGAGRDPRRGAGSCPRIEPQGQGERSSAPRTATPASARTGPESLRHFKRTYKQALQRQIATGTYDPAQPAHRPDPRGQALPLLEGDAACRETNAVIIYMMDVSGSMGDEQKEIVRIEASGSTPGCVTSTRASRRATSSTTPSRARWTATPSSTRASPAAR